MTALLAAVMSVLFLFSLRIVVYIHISIFMRVGFQKSTEFNSVFRFTNLELLTLLAFFSLTLALSQTLVPYSAIIFVLATFGHILHISYLAITSAR